MRYIQVFVALLAVLFFAVPAMSMQDNGNVASENENHGQLANGEHQCDCRDSMIPQSDMKNGKINGECNKNNDNGQSNGAQASSSEPKSMMAGKINGECNKNNDNGQSNGAQASSSEPKSMMAER